MKSDEPYGEAALMLCESLLHLLVDEGLIAKEKALEALEGVAELAGERPENDASRVSSATPSIVSIAFVFGDNSFLDEKVKETFAQHQRDTALRIRSKRLARSACR